MIDTPATVARAIASGEPGSDGEPSSAFVAVAESLGRLDQPLAPHQRATIDALRSAFLQSQVCGCGCGCGCGCRPVHSEQRCTAARAATPPQAAGRRVAHAAAAGAGAACGRRHQHARTRVGRRRVRRGRRGHAGAPHDAAGDAAGAAAAHARASTCAPCHVPATWRSIRMLCAQAATAGGYGHDVAAWWRAVAHDQPQWWATRLTQELHAGVASLLGPLCVPACRCEPASRWRWRHTAPRSPLAAPSPGSRRHWRGRRCRTVPPRTLASP